MGALTGRGIVFLLVRTTLACCYFAKQSSCYAVTSRPFLIHLSGQDVLPADKPWPSFANPSSLACHVFSVLLCANSSSLIWANLDRDLNDQKIPLEEQKTSFESSLLVWIQALGYFHNSTGFFFSGKGGGEGVAPSNHSPLTQCTEQPIAKINGRLNLV